MNNYKGVIIEESLGNKEILKECAIVDTVVESVAEQHQTPWLKQWTLHTVIIPEEKAEEMAEKIGRALEGEHNWYADYKNKQYHYIIFRDKYFKVDRSSQEQYMGVKKHGLSLGIPDYQLDFTPEIQ